MKSPVRVGDSLSHGGAVVQGSPTVTFGGIPVARLGDSAVCSKHGGVSIVGGCSSRNSVNGRPIALNGAVCSCGATISASCGRITVG